MEMTQAQINKLIEYINSGMACPPGLKRKEKACKSEPMGDCTDCILAYLARQEKLPPPF
jgi:hypothetical protein